MKKSLVRILTLVVMAVLVSATSAYAQSYAKANVPFAFNVGSAQLPAGTYEIKMASDRAIMVQNRETSATAASIVGREQARSTSAKLVFHQVGNQYFLAEIWRNSQSEGITVPTSDQEKELKKELQLAKGPSSGVVDVVVALY